MELIIFKFLVLFFTIGTSYAQIKSVTKVYIPLNTDYPAEYQAELIKIFFHSKQFRVIPDKAPVKINKNDVTLEYLKSGKKLTLKFQNKEKIIQLKGSLSEKQTILREEAFIFIHGREAFQLVKDQKWFNKNIVFNSKKPKSSSKKTVKVKKEKQIIKKDTVLTKNEINNQDPTKKAVVPSRFPISFIVGIQMYNDFGPYLESYEKRALGIESGIKLKDFSLSFEKKFMNINDANDELLKLDLNYLNMSYHTSSFYKQMILYFKIGMGQGRFQLLNHKTAEDFAYNLGLGISIQNLVRVGIQVDTISNSEEYNHVPSLYIGVGLNY